MPKTIYSKICEACGVSFETTGQQRKYCCGSCAQTGRNNSCWKGADVSIKVLHKWAERHLGRPDRCSKCGSEGKVDLANISQQYLRELTDWEWLCRKCHMESDGRLTRFLSHSAARKIPDLKCPGCGKMFASKAKGRKFCSRHCSVTHTNLHLRNYDFRRR